MRHGYNYVTMMVVRRRRLAVVLLTLSVVTTACYWIRCNNFVDYDVTDDYETTGYVADSFDSRFDRNVSEARLSQQLNVSKCQQIQCSVNNDLKTACCHDVSDIFVPFTVLAKYFEVYGKMDGKMNGSRRFKVYRTTSKIYFPRERYTSHGAYMSFEHYNVERRNHVMCISGTEEVPVSMQWSSDGYYYPTQIAQFGLSHYSKYLAARHHQNRSDVTHDDVSTLTYPSRSDANISSGRWTVEAQASSSDDVIWRRVLDPIVGRHVTEFRAPAVSLDGPAVTLSVNAASAPLRPETASTDQAATAAAAADWSFLSFDLRLADNSSSCTVTINTLSHDNLTSYRIHYTTNTERLLIGAAETGQNCAYYGIGSRGSDSWSTVTRDLAVDLLKALRSRPWRRGRRDRKRREMQDADDEDDASTLRTTFGRVVSVEFRGSGFFDNLTLSRIPPHWTMFRRAADWLVRHQDSRGGWPVPVPRRLAAGRLRLPAGWVSAMAQGQAMSLLVRAHTETGERQYLDAAIQATRVFNATSSEGGVLAKLFDRPWYEEYPTTPGVFVLNGFIYALFGLLDLKATLTPEDSERQDVDRLYSAGLTSLRVLLPLYDTGTGSVYDLRHVTSANGGQQAPNVARSDYHVTHINQLLMLASIDDDAESLFRRTATRWIGYMSGHWASHNR